MHIYFPGVCGTFMAGLAIIAKQQGFQVSGCDANVYPPMSTQLESQGIALAEGFLPKYLEPTPDLVIIGNALSRGNEMVEYVLNRGIPYMSGPQWLYEHVLKERWVLAVAGTHGKTTTSSMLAWILEYAGLRPGYLIGGVPTNFNVSARSGKPPFFVIEADEYDSAFFDKRAKFIHYHPRTCILNNLEFDHGDIYPNLAAIQRQFHFLVRTIPSLGLIVYPKDDENIKQVLAKGCWSETRSTALEEADFSTSNLQADGSAFELTQDNQVIASINWSLLGLHNVRNALTAIAAANHVGVSPKIAAEALEKFTGVKRRLEVKNKINDVIIYDDFAHHPTAIASTLQGMRNNVGNQRRIIAILELGSYTMRAGLLKDQIKDSLSTANVSYVLRPNNENWGLDNIAQQSNNKIQILATVEEIVAAVQADIQANDVIIVMGKSGFGNIHQKLFDALSTIAA